ncbi:MBL fold metallo-hydrolase [Solibacillus daqui]|uniref:MBL fold metallo-hydrolase n=1 Tax=Solibacillus daqui TaxID=2912187 RepID=UPI0023650DD3|nr:MBL fold metallo-hydrolase [Solibacillus daqui]
MKRLLWFVLALLVMLAGCTEMVETNAPAVAGKEMTVHFIDVGQGDSIFIKSPSGKTMLIDGGVKGAGKTVVDYLHSQGVTKLDYVVATHPDADHIGGLIAVLNSISIKEFIDSGKVHTSQTYEEMLTLIHNKNIRYTVPTTGDTIALDSVVNVDVLASDENAADNNDASIVLRVAYQQISFLLMGDADHGIEQQLLNSGVDVEATILKAGHHGSNTSSSAQFIKEVNPLATILSYGQDNKYGHPHAEVVDTLKQAGSDLYGTAESGTIVVATDGVTYDVNAKQWTGIGATSSITLSKSDKVELISKDLQAEIVAIQNNSNETVNLQGWKLISVEGNQEFNFPNINLVPGKKIYVTSGTDAKASGNALEWTKKQIWLNSGDAAKLKNAKGEIVSELP